MTIYYITIFTFIMIGYFYDRLSDVNNDRFKLIVFVIVIFTIVYGFRFEVGVDWFNYIRVYERQTVNIFSLDTFELGYKLLNVIAYYIGQGIVTVIFLSTLLFISFSLFALKNIGLNPFYFFAIVAPYHLVMSGLNYTRQGVALSIFIYAMSCLIKYDKKKFLLFIVLAGLFHTSALIFLPLFFIENKKRYVILVLFIILPPIFYSMLSEYQQYLDTNMDNQGLYLRALYLITPAILLSLHYKKLKYGSLIEKRLIYITVFSFFIIVIFSIVSSTIADRLSYYFILLSTMCWMLVSNSNSNRNSNSNSNSNSRKFRYLRSYGSLLLFLSSLLAFIVWTLYSSYISSYEFDSYFNYWLS